MSIVVSSKSPKALAILVGKVLGTISRFSRWPLVRNKELLFSASLYCHLMVPQFLQTKSGSPNPIQNFWNYMWSWKFSYHSNNWNVPRKPLLGMLYIRMGLESKFHSNGIAMNMWWISDWVMGILGWKYRKIEKKSLFFYIIINYKMSKNIIPNCKNYSLIKQSIILLLSSRKIILIIYPLAK